MRCGYLLCLAQKQEVVVLLKPVRVDIACGIKTCCVLASLQKAQLEQTMIAQLLVKVTARSNVQTASLRKIVGEENFH